MTKDYFAYGTLMCEDIMLAVTGHSFSRTPGSLRGYRRRSVKDELYPGIFPERGGVVKGIVYRDLPDATWALLDTFEGEMYQRKIVSVNLADSVSIEACTFVVKPEFENRLDASEWDFEKFLRSGKKTFEAHYAGFKALKNIHRT